METEKEQSSSSQSSPLRQSLLQIGLSAFAFLLGWLSSKRVEPQENPPNTPSPANDTNDERQRRQEISPSPVRVIVESLPPRHPPSAEEKTEKETKKKLKWGSFWVGAGTLVAVIWYACEAHLQRETMNDTNKITSRAFQVSQGARVTIGRKDGVIADFVVPKDPKQKAEVVIYFQNSGRLPAKFAWGTILPGLFNANPPGEQHSTGIELVHPYKGLPRRSRDLIHGSVGEYDGDSTTIGADSILVSTLGTLSQQDLANLPSNSKGGFDIMARMTYCDEIGTYSSEMFDITYRPNAPSSYLSFSLLHEGPDVPLVLPKPTSESEVLFPCETESEHKQKQK